MQGGLIGSLESLGPIAASLLVLAALALLWRRDRSVSLIVSIAAELAALVFRAALFARPELARTTPLFFPVWTLTSLMFAAGLLGYAIEASKKVSVR